jgi:hypothetical protein
MDWKRELVARVSNTYLFYLDESGQREVKAGEYFAISAVGVPLQAWHALNRQISDLKWTHFNDPDVEIKSTWPRIERERGKHYLDRYSISDGDLKEFTDAVYEAMVSHDILVFAAVIDKGRFADRCREGESALSIAYAQYMGTPPKALALKPGDTIRLRPAA